ncbi:hypothetical protein N9E28_01480 [Alphaproteobacteria bacterium]|nr:hypothetical protein [Alphaproteobacteria bacterium]
MKLKKITPRRQNFEPDLCVKIVMEKLLKVISKVDAKLTFSIPSPLLTFPSWGYFVILFVIGCLSSMPLHWLSMDLWDGVALSSAIASSDREILRNSFKFIDIFKSFNTDPYSTFYIIIMHLRSALEVDAVILMRWLSTALCGFAPIIVYIFLTKTLQFRHFSSLIFASTIPFLPVFSLLSSTTFLHIIFFFIGIFWSLTLCYSSSRLAVFFGLMFTFFNCLFPLYSVYIFVLNSLIFVVRMRQDNFTRNIAQRSILVFMIVILSASLYVVLAKDLEAGYSASFKIKDVAYRGAMYVEYLMKFKSLILLFLVTTIVFALKNSFEMLRVASWRTKALILTLFLGLIFLAIAAKKHSFFITITEKQDVRLALNYFFPNIISEDVVILFLIASLLASFATFVALLEILINIKKRNNTLISAGTVSTAQMLLVIVLIFVTILPYASFNKSPLCILDVSCKENVFDWHERHAMPLLFSLIISTAVFTQGILKTVQANIGKTIIFSKSILYIGQGMIFVLVFASLFSHFVNNHQRNLIRDRMMVGFMQNLEKHSVGVDLVQIILPSTEVIYRPRGYELNGLLGSRKTEFITTIVDSRLPANHRDYYIPPANPNFAEILQVKKNRRELNALNSGKAFCGTRIMVDAMPAEIVAFFDMKKSYAIKQRTARMKKIVQDIGFTSLVKLLCI